MNLNQVLSLGHSLMKQHGLTSLGWVFKLDNAKRRFGVCRYRRKAISISRYLAELNDEAEVKDTILHEIAHALVGPGHGHNHVWKAKCLEIGARPQRCYTLKDTKTPKLRYYAICEGCGTEHQRAKRIKPFMRSACKCQSHLPWDKKKLLTYKDRHA